MLQFVMLVSIINEKAFPPTSDTADTLSENRYIMLPSSDYQHLTLIFPPDIRHFLFHKWQENNGLFTNRSLTCQMC